MQDGVLTGEPGCGALNARSRSVLPALGVLFVAAALLGGCQAAPETVVVTPVRTAADAPTPALPLPLTAATAAPSPTTGSPTLAQAAPTAAPAAPVGAPLAASPSTTPALRPRAAVIFAEQAVSSWPNDPNSTAWLDNGAYRLFAREPDRFVAVGSPYGTVGHDVVVSALFRKVGGPPGGGYGLIVRDQGPGPRDGLNQTWRFYVLQAGDRRGVGIWRRDGDHWTELVPWTPTLAVRPGDAANQLTVRAAGPRLTLLVNGFEAASAEDTTLQGGAAGVFVGGDFNQVALEWFVIASP